MAISTDKRLYHLPTRYEAYADMSPSVIVNDMRKKLIEQYTAIANGKAAAGSGSSAEAAILQSFFKQIKLMTSKNVAHNVPAGEFSQALMQQVINNALKLNQHYGADREWFKMRGGPEQGAAFERELAAIVAAVSSMTGAGDIDFKSLVVGKQQVNIGGGSKAELADIIKPVAESWINSANEKLQKMGKDLMKNNNDLITTSVSGKIDVTALTVEYDFIATGSAKFDQAARLLQTATFTAKSYSSLISEWVDEYQELFEKKSTIQNIHFGHTKANRIYIDMLMQYADLPYPVAASFYYKLMHSRKSAETFESLSQLRWIYELTGYGQTYGVDDMASWFQKKIEQESAMGAKYLIYNDPASDNIYVKSTADMIKIAIGECINKIYRGRSSISKMFFTD